MNSLIENLNAGADRAAHLLWPMLWQSSLLIAVVFTLDVALRRKLRAAVRYALWIVVLAKLLAPPSLALPTGIAWWLRPAETAPMRWQPQAMVVTHDNSIALPEPSFAPAPLAPPTLSTAGKELCAVATVSVLLFGWLTLRWLQVARQVREASPATAELARELSAAQAEAGWRRRVRLKLTTRAMSPAVCGLFRPVLLLPASLVEKLPPDQLRAVLLHELIHLRRGDVWMNCAQALLQIIYWWHPLVWIANARIRRVREEAVDDAVMLALADNADAYAPTLLEVAKLAFTRPLASLGLIGILESRNALRQRIERLVNFTAPGRPGLTAMSLAGIAVFAALAVPMGRAQAPRAAERPALTALPKIDEPSFRLSAEHIERDTATEVELASNHVVFAHRGVYLSADAARLDQKSGEILALGHARLERDGKIFTADQIRYRIDTGEVLPPTSAMATPAPAAASSDFLAFDARLKETNAAPGAVEARFTFNLTNVSASDVVITGVVTSCGCTVAKLPATPWRLEPGASGEIPVVMNLQGKRGTIVKTVTVNSDKGSMMLQVKANIPSAPPASTTTNASDSSSTPTAVETPNDRSTNLYTRRFKVDSVTFLARLHERTGYVANHNADDLQAAMQKVFSAAGVDLHAPGVSVFFTEREGVLLVHASTSALDAIERVVQALNEPIKQVTVGARFVTVPENDDLLHGVGWLMTDRATLRDGSAGSNGVAVTASVLTSGQLETILRALDQDKNASLFSKGQVTTLSGRRAQLQTADEMTVVTGIKPAALRPPGVATTHGTNELFETRDDFLSGTVLDIQPDVGRDGSSIELAVTAMFREFLGYEKSTNAATVYVDGKKQTIDLPLPNVRSREVATRAIVWDGQTIVLTGLTSEAVDRVKHKLPMLGDLPFLDHLFRAESRRTKKQNMLVFVTATIIDPAGNRVHRDEDLPFAQNSIPEQPGAR